MSRTPLGVTVGSLAVLGPRATAEIARLAESMGYGSLWTAEATGTDAFTPLATVSAVAPGMGLGTGIVPSSSARQHSPPCPPRRCRR